MLTKEGGIPWIHEKDVRMGYFKISGLMSAACYQISWVSTTKSDIGFHWFQLNDKSPCFSSVGRNNTRLKLWNKASASLMKATKQLGMGFEAHHMEKWSLNLDCTWGNGPSNLHHMPTTTNFNRQAKGILSHLTCYVLANFLPFHINMRRTPISYPIPLHHLSPFHAPAFTFPPTVPL